MGNSHHPSVSKKSQSCPILWTSALCPRTLALAAQPLCEEATQAQGPPHAGVPAEVPALSPMKGRHASEPSDDGSSP